MKEINNETEKEKRVKKKDKVAVKEKNKPRDVQNLEKGLMIKEKVGLGGLEVETEETKGGRESLESDIVQNWGDGAGKSGRVASKDNTGEKNRVRFQLPGDVCNDEEKVVEKSLMDVVDSEAAE